MTLSEKRKCGSFLGDIQAIRPQVSLTMRVLHGNVTRFFFGSVTVAKFVRVRARSYPK